MSDFFGSLVSGLGDLVTPQTVATIGGALISSNANQNAANTVAAGNTAAAQTTADSGQAARDAFLAASQRGVADINQGTTDFTNTIDPILSQSAITLPQNRGLTQQQQIGLADQQRSEGATLAASGLRGAGRAGIASEMDADGRYIAQAHAANDADTLSALRNQQTVQNQARTGLAQIQAQAGGAKANTEIGAGNQIGSSLQQQGNTTANLQTNTAANQAAATIGTGKTDASATGTLSSVVANSGNSPNSPTVYGTDPLDSGGAQKAFSQTDSSGDTPWVNS